MTKRNYREEYDTYQGTEEQKKNRAQRNKARREMVRKGRAAKGDGKDVDHIQPLSKGGTSASSNLRIRSRHANRGDK